MNEHIRDYSLTTDNTYPTIKVFIPHDMVGVAEGILKNKLGWRTSTRKYNSIMERFMNSGSTTYDKGIKALAEYGFDKDKSAYNYNINPDDEGDDLPF